MIEHLTNKLVSSSIKSKQTRIYGLSTGDYEQMHFNTMIVFCVTVVRHTPIKLRRTISSTAGKAWPLVLPVALLSSPRSYFVHIFQIKAGYFTHLFHAGTCTRMLILMFVLFKAHMKNNIIERNLMPTDLYKSNASKRPGRTRRLLC